MVEPLLKMTRVTKTYFRKNECVTAADGIDLAVAKGEVIGIVGPSGAGKSTLARMAAGLEKPDDGEVLINGINIYKMNGKTRRLLPKTVQIIWQDPTVYLNPFQTIFRSITEPLEAFEIGRSDAIRNRGLELMDMVELPLELSRCRPGVLSGGQCQRAAIARALALEPSLLICDEALAGLDLPQQVRMLKLLGRLQRKKDLGVMFISHDIDHLRKLEARTAFIQNGRIVKWFSKDDMPPLFRTRCL